GQVLLAAPDHESNTRIGQPVLVTADIDRHHPRQAEVPFQLRMQERHHESTAGRVHVHRDVHTAAGGQLVQRRTDFGDRLEFAGVGGAEYPDHADGVFVDSVDHLLGCNDVTAFFHRQVTRL